MASHKSLRISSLSLLFFCSNDSIISNNLSSSSDSFFSANPVSYWSPLVNFSSYHILQLQHLFLVLFFIASMSLLVFSLCSCIIFLVSFRRLQHLWAHWAPLWWLFWILCWVIRFHLFRVGFWNFILFLWLSPESLFLCMPCYLLLEIGYLKKQPPRLVFMKFFTRERPIIPANDSGSLSNLSGMCLLQALVHLSPAGLWLFPTSE